MTCLQTPPVPAVSVTDGIPAAVLLAGQACEATYTGDGDGLTLRFSSADAYDDTDELAGDLIADYDSQRKLLGFEVVFASEHICGLPAKFQLQQQYDADQDVLLLQFGDDTGVPASASATADERVTLLSDSSGAWTGLSVANASQTLSWAGP